MRCRKPRQGEAGVGSRRPSQAPALGPPNQAGRAASAAPAQAAAQEAASLVCCCPLGEPRSMTMEDLLPPTSLLRLLICKVSRDYQILLRPFRAPE